MRHKNDKENEPHLFKAFHVSKVLLAPNMFRSGGLGGELHLKYKTNSTLEYKVPTKEKCKTIL